ncbi:MAG TPA: PH domain-containing protein [Candidatus Saccharimonadales bacterium]|nr:PH domain-containing protein [Candidatus Saccharimonadales bacterium]
MPNKYFADQFDDEDVLLVFRKHPIVMRKGLVLAMLGPLLGVIPAATKPSLGFGWFFGGLLAGFVAGGLCFLPSWIAWFYSVFIVSDQRFIQITQKGLFHRSVVDIGLNQIQMVNYEIAGMQETLLGFGTIMVQTYVGDLVVHDVHHPAKIQKKMLHILRDQGVIVTSHPIKRGEQEASEELAEE